MSSVLGISAFYHDSAAALLRDGEIVAAVQEERFTPKKHDSAFNRDEPVACLGNEWEATATDMALIIVPRVRNTTCPSATLVSKCWRLLNA